MTLQNRIDPFGRLHAEPVRGAWMGNRGGCFHRVDQTLRPQHWVSKRWIYCLILFRGRQRAVMTPGKYTEVFFLDEATALAAGHRPCFECQRERATAYKAALVRAGRMSAKCRVSELDAEIAGDVIQRLKGQRSAKLVRTDALPNGVMFESQGAAFLKWNETSWRWSFGGYEQVRLPAEGRLLTPEATVSALGRGFVPQVHFSAHSV